MLKIPKSEYKKIVSEMDRLKHKLKLIRKRMGDALQDSTSNPAKNAGYFTAYEEEQTTISRINELSRLISSLQPIENGHIKESGLVDVGCFVEVVRIDNNEKIVYKIVASYFMDEEDEIDLVSSTSLVGRALIGKREGDLVNIVTEKESYSIRIIKTWYR